MTQTVGACWINQTGFLISETFSTAPLLLKTAGLRPFVLANLTSRALDTHQDAIRECFQENCLDLP